MRQNVTYYEFYFELENKNILYKNDEGAKTRISFYLPFVEQRKDIDRVRLHCLTSRHLLNLFMLILVIFVFFLNLQLI